MRRPDRPSSYLLQTVHSENRGESFVEWFSGKLIATFSLVYNAEFMVQQGMGCMITADNLANTSVNPDLCFRPLTPVLEAGLTIAWSKQEKRLFPARLSHQEGFPDLPC